MHIYYLGLPITVTQPERPAEGLEGSAWLIALIGKQNPKKL